MREDFWGFVPSHTVILATNHKPIVRGTDNGIWRRIKLVPFTVTIPAAEQDSELKKKLEAEWPAILRWIVTGCIEWQREGLQEPEEVLEATNNYRTDMDVLGEFLKECCVRGEGYQVGATALYKTYRDWAGARGEFVETQTKFGTKLSERGLIKGHDSRKRVVYLELGLLAADRGGPEGPEGSDPF
jgi:putative DNA primase/helicase